MELEIRLEGVHMECAVLLIMFAVPWIPALCSAVSAGKARGGHKLTERWRPGLWKGVHERGEIERVRRRMLDGWVLSPVLPFCNGGSLQVLNLVSVSC